jgi:hypothetical protein
VDWLLYLSLDNSSNVIFETTMGDPTKSASQFALAMVYGF